MAVSVKLNQWRLSLDPRSMSGMEIEKKMKKRSAKVKP